MAVYDSVDNILRMTGLHGSVDIQASTVDFQMPYRCIHVYTDSETWLFLDLTVQFSLKQAHGLKVDNKILSISLPHMLSQFVLCADSHHFDRHGFYKKDITATCNARSTPGYTNYTANKQ